MKLATLILTSLLATSAQAASREDVRKAVNAIPEAKIQAELQVALKDNSLEGRKSEKEIDYTICPVKLENYCYRFVAFSVSKPGNDLYSVDGSLVLEYAASAEDNKKIVLLDASSRYRDTRAEVNKGNFDTFRLALAQLEKDYAGDMPVKYGAAVHPLNVTLLQIEAQGERMNMDGDNDHWETSSVTLVSFSEGIESRVTYYQHSLSYLVRTVDNGEKILKSDVRRLNFGKRLKKSAGF